MVRPNPFADLYVLSDSDLRTKCTERNLPFDNTTLRHELIYKLLRADYDAVKVRHAKLQSTTTDPFDDPVGYHLLNDILEAISEIHTLRTGILKCAEIQIDIRGKEAAEIKAMGASLGLLNSEVKHMRAEFEEWTDCGFTV